jgi:hypothetical protein
MNAHREIVKPHKGVLRIEIPEEMKNADAIEVFMVVADTLSKIQKKKEGGFDQTGRKVQRLAK